VSTAPRDEDRRYWFAGHCLDVARGVVLDPQGRELPLRPKSFALLQYLVDHPGRLLSRDELFEALWPGLAVSDDSLTQCVSDLRRALGGQAAAILRTVPRRGYMLVAEVSRAGPAKAEAAVTAPAALEQPPLELLRRETLLVLPSTTPPGATLAARLAPGIVAGLVTELLRFEDLRIVTSADSAQDRGYVLRSELDAAGGVLRAFLRLEDLATGTAIWGERMEWPEAQAAPPLTTVTALVGEIDLQIDRKSLRRAQQLPEAQRTARDFNLIGRDLHQRGTEAETIAARAMFRRAAELDPGFAAPWAWAAFTMMRVVTFAWSTATHGGGVEEAIRLARKAVELDPESALCQSALAFALSLAEMWDEAVETARLALRFSRVADHATRMACGEVLSAGGQPEETVVALEATLALDPHCPPRTRAVLGRALLLADRPEDALRELRRCAARLPDYAPCARTMVVAAVECGAFDEARAALQVVRRLRPQWIPGEQPIYWFLRRPEDVARFEKGFAIAQRLDIVAASGGLARGSPTPS
jgi:DNA-binding winged helix-turn-helix (wHTH) protein/tetratricopeptide (TPR) repeat protein